MTITRMDARPPWACPRCGAAAGEPCLANTSAKSKYLPQMHISRWWAAREPGDAEDRFVDDGLHKVEPDVPQHLWAAWAELKATRAIVHGWDRQSAKAAGVEPLLRLAEAHLQRLEDEFAGAMAEPETGMRCPLCGLITCDCEIGEPEAA